MKRNLKSLLMVTIVAASVMFGMVGCQSETSTHNSPETNPDRPKTVYNNPSEVTPIPTSKAIRFIAEDELSDDDMAIIAKYTNMHGLDLHYLMEGGDAQAYEVVLAHAYWDDEYISHSPIAMMMFVYKYQGSFDNWYDMYWEYLFSIPEEDAGNPESLNNYIHAEFDLDGMSDEITHPFMMPTLEQCLYELAQTDLVEN